ncbi:hypothetical protein GCM10010495_79340 [Kitasatospora herbaricolor]|uniref:TolB family protein n=1 Tax=Kitasatospora herbaricolor TaxID=68217 RepID=UPI00174BE1D7|nr:PD40 domain-containing protein [Kitasatospora herbaricolor]MDQ0309352.1 hypothetical protein [Kitasatospora herbaricolor]GGV49671.1 hypothetical protein GCM10010495_79340 [Kitasatospora herbaricolor]
MSVRTRLSTVAAVALTTAVTAGAAALLAGCGPENPGGPAAAPPVTAPPVTAALSGAGTAPAPSGTAAPATTAATPAAVNGTAGNHLTVSNGTDHVLMNGTSVDFGTVVRDLAWSPDGAKAAFVDGAGNLMVADPDGSGRVLVARAPGGETWSHPTWQVSSVVPDVEVPLKNTIFFAAAKGGVSRLKGIAATAVDGTPEVLSLGAEEGPDIEPLPQTGNTWPSAAGPHGTAVYANSGTGEVYIRDDFLRQQGSPLLPGSQPALAPGGEDLVFVRSVGGHDHVFEGEVARRPAKDLTPGATTDFTEPAWSPDGRTLAVRAPDGIYTLPVDGSAAPVRISTYTGLPAYRP